jgi:leucyl aminopeptidase
MKFNSLSANLQNINCDLLVVPVTVQEFESCQKNSANSKKDLLEVSLKSINHLFGGETIKTLLRSDFKVDVDGSSFVFNLAHPQIGSILVYSIGNSFKNLSETYQQISWYRNLGSSIYSTAKKLSAKNITIVSKDLKLEKSDFLSALIEGIKLTSYSFDFYKKQKVTKFEPNIFILGSAKIINQKLIDQVLVNCEATCLARDLINLAPNDCNSDYLVSIAKQIATKGKLKIEIFDKAKLEKMGAGLILGVNKGSSQPPYLVKLTYKPAVTPKNLKIISLVGKGVTFDTGGYSLKPADAMIGMKCDMSGAACVLGVMQAISHSKPNCEVRGYIPIVENMVNGEATRVGDIIKAMDGTTVEVLNTDAEGRLILADAITLACKDKCDVLIDIATLTGACMVALGMQYAGLFCDDKKLSELIIEAGKNSDELFWSLPLAKEYEESIKSKVADIKNIGNGRWAGATIGALFLKHFVRSSKWAHLDIAGPADSDSDRGFIKTGGVGFGIRTLIKVISQYK